jgi:hypothetical protein
MASRLGDGAVAENRNRRPPFSQPCYRPTKSASVTGVLFSPRLQEVAKACTKRHQSWRESDRNLLSRRQKADHRGLMRRSKRLSAARPTSPRDA